MFRDLFHQILSDRYALREVWVLIHRVDFQADKQSDLICVKQGSCNLNGTAFIFLRQEIDVTLSYFEPFED